MSWRQPRPQDMRAVVLQALRDGMQHALEISDACHVSPGRLYPELARLEAAGTIRSGWTISKPQRRVYWIDGIES